MSNFTALIVEDNDMVRELLTLTLEPICQSVGAENAEQALELIEHFHTDIAIIDVNLGRGLNGFDLCRKLRENKRYQHLPILIISGNGDATWQTAQALKVNGFISKPYSPIKLLDQVSTLMGIGEGC